MIFGLGEGGGVGHLNFYLFITYIKRNRNIDRKRCNKSRTIRVTRKSRKRQQIKKTLNIKFVTENCEVFLLHLSFKVDLRH